MEKGLERVIDDMRSEYSPLVNEMNSYTSLVRNRVKDLSSSDKNLGAIAGEVAKYGEVPDLREIRMKHKSSPFDEDTIHRNSLRVKELMDNLENADLEEEQPSDIQSIAREHESLEHITREVSKASGFAGDLAKDIYDRLRTSMKSKNIRTITSTIKSYARSVEEHSNDIARLLKARFVGEFYNLSTHDQHLHDAMQEAKEELVSLRKDKSYDEFISEHKQDVIKHYNNIRQYALEMPKALDQQLVWMLVDLSGEQEISEAIRGRYNIARSRDTLQSEYIEGMEELLGDLTRKVPLEDIQDELKHTKAKLEKGAPFHNKLAIYITKMLGLDERTSFNIRGYSNQKRRMSTRAVEKNIRDVDSLKEDYDHTRDCLDGSVKGVNMDELFEGQDPKVLLEVYSGSTNLDPEDAIYALENSAEHIIDGSEKVLGTTYSIIGDNRSYTFSNNRAKDFFRRGVMGRRGFDIIPDSRAEFEALKSSYHGSE